MASLSTPPYIQGPLYSKDRQRYFPDDDLLAAANAALALGLPLLLTGEPGCGKTQFAWALASALQRRGERNGQGGPDFDDPLDCYVRSDTRARDLLYHYDSLRRFGDTQVANVGKSAHVGDARNYIVLKSLGIALMSRERRVVLIDEIDKAPRDLPNDLLRELDQGNFDIPEVDQEPPKAGEPANYGQIVCRNSKIPLWRVMERPAGAEKPFILITSNIERQLPDAFLRRCIFYHIKFPSPQQLQMILNSRYGLGSEPSAPPAGSAARIAASPEERSFVQAILPRAQGIFLKLREMKLSKSPATAELFNWIDALIRFRQHPHWDCHRRLDEVGPTINTREPEQLSPSPLWQRVPGLSCLVKLREDLDVLLGNDEPRVESASTGARG